MKRYKFQANKLIKDKMIEIFAKQGIQASTYIIDNQAEYEQMLKEKVVEEVYEATVTAKTTAKMMSEFVDAIEAIYTLCELHGITKEDIEKHRLEKAAEKGGYKSKIYCKTLEMDEDNPKLNHYLENSNRYPEIK